MRELPLLRQLMHEDRLQMEACPEELGPGFRLLSKHRVEMLLRPAEDPQRQVEQGLAEASESPCAVHVEERCGEVIEAFGNQVERGVGHRVR